MGREAQPYRRGPRQPGMALDAMLKGRTASGFNPKDIERNVQRLVRARPTSQRPSRPSRPERPSRPPR